MPRYALKPIAPPAPCPMSPSSVIECMPCSCIAPNNSSIVFTPSPPPAVCAVYPKSIDHGIHVSALMLAVSSASSLYDSYTPRHR